MDVGEEIERPRILLVVATLLLVTASWVAFLVPVAIGHFRGTLSALGADLPASTQVLLTTPRIWIIFVALGLALFIWVMARSRAPRAELRRMKLSMILLTVAMAVAYGFAFSALNVAAFNGGKVI
jgi:glucan phosphoethanolaminetransferase (alkaline phosphatase superfamily)